jgi:hypothetical protein
MIAEILAAIAALVPFPGCGKTLSMKVRASQAAEKLCFVSGHDFSRAVND